ncbi:N-acetylmuramoyl-L-alanine amidase [Desulfoluna sp.]|uniref:N-acetylmuramoyl-L-alanine amidase n=1 Tax=Desulfoluna sp. TaxID=2045199 RepID=UPI0026212BB7|nr:N-acetylmuramoyl-L-alanine amidase [Desulfoluna sp.]
MQQIRVSHQRANAPSKSHGFPWAVAVVRLLLLVCLLTGPLTVSAAPAQDEAKKAYLSAESYHRKLLKKISWKNRRDKWEVCADKYLDAWRKDKRGPWAPAGLFQAGKLYMELEKFSGRRADLERARDLLTQTRGFESSRYSQEATKLLRRLPKVTVKPAPAKPQPVVKSPETRKTNKPVTVPEKKTAPPPVNGAITHIRYGTLPSRTRIVLDTRGALVFTHGMLRHDPKTKKPKRIWIDIKGHAQNTLKSSITLESDPRVKQVRSGLFKPGVVRVVVDAVNFSHYKVFPLKKPNRIVVDIWSGSQPTHPPIKNETKPAIDELFTPEDLARQLALGVRRIVIDAGHGGKDNGAPGYYKGVSEKNIVLSLSKRLAVKLRKELKCEVILTRSNDRYLSLDERTTLANRKRADLFISIHANASRNKKAYGVETYFLNLAKDRDSINVAARENATSEKNISDLHTILNSLMKNAKINESSRLAQYVQSSLVSSLSKNYTRIRNKGVKQAPFYVLLGARMPAILVETGFISNKSECKRLTSATYQDKICEGIVKGVKRYIDSTHPSSIAHGTP